VGIGGAMNGLGWEEAYYNNFGFGAKAHRQGANIEIDY